MKVSIITASYNNKDTIEQCIKSVAAQNYENIEHIVIDGGSTDGTVDIIRQYEAGISYWKSERDEGTYHALNKGISLATGDVIGILHADDFYPHNNVLDIAMSGILNYEVDSCYGDLQYVSKKDRNRTVRHWTSRPYEDGLFDRGWMPPHPTFFVRKEVYERYGLFNTGYKIAADYELMMRFLCTHKISTCYIPGVFVKMRTGGRSNRGLKNLILKSREDYKICKNSGSGLYTVVMKNLSKLPQFFR
ncbi:MAG: glycosyltransferase [Nitrospirota bacterium]|nr:glycosyltransferase [Nitrospirota bacterium]